LSNCLKQYLWKQGDVSSNELFSAVVFGMLRQSFKLMNDMFGYILLGPIPSTAVISDGVILVIEILNVTKKEIFSSFPEYDVINLRTFPVC
jgi:hypothetical protein